MSPYKLLDGEVSHCPEEPRLTNIIMESETFTPTVEDSLLTTTVYDYTFYDVIPEIQPIQILTLVFYAIVFILGVPGNALVVWVTGFAMPRSVTTIWFLNLSLADFLCCLFLPILMVPLTKDDHWDFGPSACTVFKSIFYLAMYCSILLLVLISLDRCMLVSWPVWCQNNRRPWLAVWASVGAWVLALVATIPELLYTREVDHGSKKECIAVRSKVTGQIIIGFRFVVGFLLPFLVIVVSHSLVYMKARTMSGNTNSKRTLRVILTVAASFFFCWLPLHILDILMSVTPRFSEHRPNMNLAHALALCLAYLNSCINPIIYVCMGRDFRSSMNRSLRDRFQFFREDSTWRKTSVTANSTAISKSTSTPTVDMTTAT